MASFVLAVQSFTPPTLPEQPDDVPPSAFRSPLIPSVAAATTPLKFTVSLPGARAKKPLHPATHLQLSYRFEGTGEVFVPKFITSEDLEAVETGAAETSPVFAVQVPPEDVPRPKVNHDTSSAADITVYAWRNEKLLGKWTLGHIENLGIVGMKSTDIARLRQATWAANRENQAK